MENIFSGRLFVALRIWTWLVRQILDTPALHPLGSVSLRSWSLLRLFRHGSCVWFLMHATERHPFIGHVCLCLKTLHIKIHIEGMGCTVGGA
jgi:hypothetical protein